MSANRLGISGRIAQFFIDNQLTPLLALTGLLLGLFAVMVTPREEEPQIDVTMANVMIPFPGASSAQVESLISEPMEQVLAEINGVKHLYSTSRPDMAILTVEFKVGVKRNDALVRLYNAVYSNLDTRPANLGWMQPIIKPKAIDDVPIVTVTLWTKDQHRGAYELSRVAHAVEGELKRVRGARNVYTVGSPDDVVRVELDPQRLAGHGLTATELMARLQAANVVQQAGALVGDGRDTPVQAGEFLAGRDDVAGLVVGVHDGRPVFLQDVANVTRGPDQPNQYVWMGAGPSGASRGVDLKGISPAVTVALSKQPGTNAVDVANRVIRQLEALKGVVIPDGVQATVTRNYGQTAEDKAMKLIEKLAFATTSVVLLVLLALGWREAIVVGAAVVVTLAATLFASWAWGFTLNRVSLFALIFSIGILVDDAIVVVENIHRHMALGDRKLLQAIPAAVDEVGGPTILATLTVIAALIPMAFVTGLMGPYMSPIPINASLGMLISLGVAFVFSPWLANKAMAGHDFSKHPAHGAARLESLFHRVMTPFLTSPHARRNRRRLYLGTLVAIVAALSLVAMKWVVLKMLPFDNKSEFQVILNMPEGTTVEKTSEVLSELAAEVRKVPEVTDFEAYAGTAAPINFNGLVRQYYLRASPELGDLQVNLVDKHKRKRQSHEIAVALRPALAAIGKRYGASVQVVEVPPGPPVMAPIVAEIYGPSYAAQRKLARDIRRMFDTTPDIVDVDDSIEAAADRFIVQVDRQKAAMLGVPQQSVTDTLAMGLAGMDATYIRAGREKYPIPVRLELPVSEKASLDRLLALRVRTASGGLVPLSEVTHTERVGWDPVIYRKDGSRYTWVTGDGGGKLDSPLYGMFDMVGRVRDERPGGYDIQQYFTQEPGPTAGFAIKWDGEWQITYETFRDMGLAYSVGLILIYLLVVAQFGSYAVPLVIMAPIPLTLIGIMPGHALLHAQFTATSMIGMIALAGIIVRNSILLVDFVNVELAAGMELSQAVIRAGAVRAKPIVLTALAAMLGAFFILDDPIFNGLAVSLIFGIFVSTLLTLLVIPILYYSYRRRKEKA